MSEEEFFVRLRERAWLKLRQGKDLGKYNEALEQLAIGPRNGVNAAIEALKEMMVGEARRAIVYHQGGNVDPYTIMRWGIYIWWVGEGRIGTDGEEVMVLVVRCGEP